MHRLISILMICCLIAAVPSAYAQRDAELVTQGPRRHLGTIVFAGLAGAILGLSTLSFYGRPQDKLSNIAVGFALGVIGGTLYTTYKAAAEPKDFYGHYEPEAWRLSARLGAPEPYTPRAGFTFEF